MRRGAEINFFVFVMVIMGAVVVRADDDGDWPELEQIPVDLEEQDKYDEALAVLELLVDSFPAWEFEVSKELVYLYRKTGQPEKNFGVWEEGHKKGFFYLLNPRLPQYKDLADDETFLRLVERDMALRDSTLAESQTIYEVISPVAMEADRRYPLVIVLHGGGRYGFQ